MMETDLQSILERVVTWGYAVSISCTRPGESRMPLRDEDIEVGRDKPWFCTIRYSNPPSAFMTGYGDDPIEAIGEACEKILGSDTKPDFHA
jgi:hypothetical protein